LAKTEIWLGD